VRLSFLIPGPLEARTGGYEYDRQITRALRARGVAVNVVALDGSFPAPTDAARAHATHVLAAVPDGALVMVDGLAFGAMADEAAREARRLRLVALVHHPLADETGREPHEAAALKDSETRALAATRLAVVTSPATGRRLADFGVPASRVLVVEPGTEPAAPARGSEGGANGVASVHLLCVATLIPRKGHDVLLRALAGLVDLPWRLTCVGSGDLHPPTTAALLQFVREHGLENRVAFAGEVDGDHIDTYYDAADVLVMPTRYEGYGMAVAEGLARGLPVVSTATGAIGDLVGADAGLLVPVDDQAALTRALRTVIADPVARARLREGALRVRARLSTWDDSAARLAAALAALTGTPSPGTESGRGDV
jgi:glycosyltransferase involved in cell wall biosynthesis